MANEYLTRTPTSTGNRKVWTISVWIKLSNTSSTSIIRTSSSGTSAESGVYFNSSRVNFEYYNGPGQNYYQTESPLRRDFSSWSHVLVSCDSTKVDLENERTIFYVNGVRTSSLSADTPLPLNTDTFLNLLGRQVNIGSRPVSSADQFFQGEMFDVFLVDGQALTPDVFGFYKVGKGYVSAGSTQSTDFRPGQWVPKTSRVIKTAINNSGGFGVNGFYLPMNDSNNFGADFHCEPNSIIKLQENLPQPRSRIDGVGDYTGALRDDPFKQYLVLALPFVSGGLNSGFGDYSAAIKGSGTPKTITNSNVSIGNTASYYGSAGSFNGSNSFMTASMGSDLSFGTDDFTIEFWAYVLNNSSNAYIFDTNVNGMVIGYGNPVGSPSLNRWRYYNGSNGSWTLYTSNPEPVLNQWTHISLCRNKGRTTFYVNGVATSAELDSTNYTNVNSSTLNIGRYGAGGNIHNGYLQDLRIYKGVAKYTGGFDVPRPYTPVGIATWRAVPDSPANNFATWNAVQNSMSLTDGNLTCTGTGSDQEVYSTIGITTGKWYVEARTNVGTYNHFGVRANSTTTYGTDYRLIARDDGNVYGDTSQGQVGTLSSGYASAGNIVAMAIDGNLGQITYYVNGANVGGPYSIYQYNSSSLPTPYKIYNLVNNGDSLTVNFGQNPSFSGNTTAGTYTDSNNKGLFKYQPPSGFLALCEDNLPTPAISDPGKHFKTVLWTGDGNSGRSIVGVGFTPDLVWIKNRNAATWHLITDSVRGPNRALYSNQTYAENQTASNPVLGSVLSFNSDGFSLAVDPDSNGNNGWNNSGNSLVAWCWRAGAGTTSTNTNGSITSVVSVNQDAGFSIVSYTGTGANATVGHGLNKKPKMVIVKRRDAVTNWPIWFEGVSTNTDQVLQLNLTNASASASTFFNSSNTTTTTFPLGTGGGQTNASGSPHIAYCWAEIEGYSKFGSYTGNNSTDGPFCYCGFRPAFIIIKRTDSIGSWVLKDSSRNSANPVDLSILANVSDVEYSSNSPIDFLSNGFKLRSTSLNDSGATFIFAAFAESPFQTANAK